MPYEVPALPYDYAALEPHIDEQTMRLHHDKHHQAYVDNLNKALDGTEWADRPIEQVLALLDELPEDRRAAVRNNGGGHANHSLFWTIMSASGGGKRTLALLMAGLNPGTDVHRAAETINQAVEQGSGFPEQIEQLVACRHVASGSIQNGRANQSNLPHVYYQSIPNTFDGAVCHAAVDLPRISNCSKDLAVRNCN